MMPADCEPSASTSSSSVASKEKTTSSFSPSPEDPSTSGVSTNRKVSADSLHRGNSSPGTEKCPICLGDPVDESKTEACQHRFCFVCLVEWSKIKTQCPMCKAPFKKIIHNTKVDESGETCETFDVPEPAPPEPVPRRFRYQTAMGRERSELLRQIRELQTRLTIMDNARRAENPFLQMRRQHLIGRIGRARGSDALTEFQRAREAMIAARAEQGRRAVHDSLRRYQRLYDDSENATREQLIGDPEFRRLIYERGLRVLPMETNGRVRDCSPRFLRNNEALRHRLIAWLTRELSILLHNNAQRVSSVTALIIELMQQYDMNSEEFRSRIRMHVPYFEHFLHEFASFAHSPYDLPEYDRRCEYQRRGTSPIPVEPGERQVDADDGDIQVVAESARLREVVQRQAEAVRRQTEAADRSTAAISAAVANITAHITRFSQSPLTAWLQPAINLGRRVDDLNNPLAFNNPVVQMYDANNAAASMSSSASTSTSSLNQGSHGGDYDLHDVQLISPSGARSSTQQSGRIGMGNGRRRSLLFEDLEEDVDSGATADNDDDVQLVMSPPVRRVVSSPNLRQQLEAIMNGTANVPQHRYDTNPMRQREISLIDISSPPPAMSTSSDSVETVRRVEEERGRGEDYNAGTSQGYSASWATSDGQLPVERQAAPQRRQQSTYAYFDSDTSTPSPPQPSNTFRLVDDPDEDVIVEFASSDSNHRLGDSPLTTPSPAGAVDISDLNEIRRIEREIEETIEANRHELQVGERRDEEDVAEAAGQPGSSSWSDDSDVEVLAELKPKHLRTPPLVELDDLDNSPDNQGVPMETGRIKVEKEDSKGPSTSASASSHSRKRRRSRDRELRDSPSRDRHEDGERRRHKKHKKHKKHHKSSSSHSKSKKRRREESSPDDSDDSNRRRRRHRKHRRHDSPTDDSSSSSDEE